MKVALERSETLQHLTHEGKLAIAGGVYDLSSGKVTTLGAGHEHSGHK